MVWIAPIKHSWVAGVARGGGGLDPVEDAGDARVDARVVRHRAAVAKGDHADQGVAAADVCVEGGGGIVYMAEGIFLGPI